MKNFLRPHFFVGGLMLTSCTSAGNSAGEATTAAPATTLFVGDAEVDDAIAMFDDCKTESPPPDAFLETDPGSPIQPVNETSAPGGYIEFQWDVDGIYEFAPNSMTVFCWSGVLEDERIPNSLGWSMVYTAIDIHSGRGTAQFLAPETEYGTIGPTGSFDSNDTSHVKIPTFASPGSYLIKFNTSPSESGPNEFFFHVEVE